MKKMIIAAALAAVAGPALTSSIAAQTAPAPAAPATPAVRDFGPWGVDLTARDISVKPGDSFFDHVNGGWYARTAIPADLPMTGVGVDTHLKTQAQLRSVIEDSARNGDSPTASKIGGLYASFMDEDRLNQLDAAPLQSDLAAVKAIREKAEMAELMAKATHGFGKSLFDFGVIPDFKAPKVYVAAISPSGMGLPDRDYYLSPTFKPQRDAYAAYLARTLSMIGWPDAEAAANAVIALETRVAEATWPLAEQRDPDKVYKPMTPAELRAHAPGFDWDNYFRGLGAPNLPRLIVAQDSAIPKMAAIYADTPLDILKAWQAFHITHAASPYLSNRFAENRFAFTRTLTGQQQMQPRWQRGVSIVNSVLGEALGQEYVARHFPASSKAKMEEMVRNLQNAMRARIRAATWMSPTTRSEALRKLDLQRVKVGYPNKWRDYSGLRIDPSDMYGNVRRAMAFHFNFSANRIGQPVDREEWAMTPQTYNAYHNPLANEIVFPAAMLQSPMFDPKADPAVNYGAIGSVIGHEISHGFDDTGRKFDANGELRDWWAPEDAARFMREAGKLVAQYDSYEGAPGMNVNGKLTLGENIGDQAGLLIAYDAYKASLGRKQAPVIGGFTGDQRFFLAFAQAWQAKKREDLVKMTLASDPHSPARWRVDGTLRNIDAFYSAFGIRPGEKLYLKPEDRVRIW